MTTQSFLFSQKVGIAWLSLAAFGETTEANERGAVCAASAIEGTLGWTGRKIRESSEKRDTEVEVERRGVGGTHGARSAGDSVGQGTARRGKWVRVGSSLLFG